MKKLVLCLLVGLVLVGVVSAAEFQKVEVNDLSDKNVESIVSSGAGIFKIKMFFDESVNFVDSDVLVQKVSFPGGIESVGDALDPVSVSGSGTMNLVINFEVASVIDGWVKIAFKETEFYIGSLRADYCGPGTGEPDRTFSEEDSVCFMEKYNISSLEADFHGDSFFDLVPNGIINKLDMAGFTEVYQVADAEGKSLDALPEDVELPDLVAEDDMDTCLDALDNWWDQKTDKCYNDFSTMPIYKRCIDPDGGQNIYEYAHTFGFRSYSSAEDPSRDLRIRTGGSDGCLEDGRLLEHYCDENGYIRTTYIDCPNGCGEERGECARGESIKEEIKCIFKNSKEEQECYLAGNFGPEDEGTKFCKGKESCVIDFKGYEGEEITWKSTCGGYQYTKMDGEREKIEFDCGVGKANLTEIKDRI